MSYSFSIKAASKAEALVAVAAEFDKVVASQEVHKADKDLAMKHAEAVVGFLPDDPVREVAVSCNGYLSWSALPAEQHFGGVSVACSASLVEKKA